MIDAVAFHHSLCLHLATTASLSYLTQPRQLWRGQAVEAASTDPFAVATMYPGSPSQWHPLQQFSVQFMTTGTNADSAMALARSLWSACHDSDGRPARMRTIDGWTVAGVEAADYVIVSANPLQSPGVIGVDDRRRTQIAFSVDLGVFQKGAI